MLTIHDIAESRLEVRVRRGKGEDEVAGEVSAHIHAVISRATIKRLHRII